MVNSPFTVETAARFKSGMGFSGDRVVGYKMCLKIMRTSGSLRKLLDSIPSLLNEHWCWIILSQCLMSMPSMNKFHSFIQKLYLTIPALMPWARYA